MTDKLNDAHQARYSRQILFHEIGERGQGRLLASRVTLVGCGALGTVLANTLVRAGVGFVRICDRDFIERNNLQRQVLFDEDDIAANLPKAEAAARKLRRINSGVTVEGVVTDVNHTNIERLAEGAHLLLDGTDNFETRYLINDLAVATGRPWIYGAVIGATGMCMPIIPGETACLRCVFDEPPPPELTPTCDTAGVIGPAVNIVASFQAQEAIKILTGRSDALIRGLMNLDIWTGRNTIVNVQPGFEKGDCPCCKRKRFDYLDGSAGSRATSLCGRDAVQIDPRRDGGRTNFEAVAAKLRGIATGEVLQNAFMVRCTVGEYDITVFADGRAIIKGTADVETARTVYAKYVGA